MAGPPQDADRAVPGMTVDGGCLYVVATPIGNLGDLSARAQAVLAGVDTICAEDTRVTGALLRHLGIQRPLVSLHEHNEHELVDSLVARLRAGQALALVSDAGTPLVSDPGYALVHAARRAGLAVLPVPGPSAAMAALSVSGLPTDRFVFEGFLPPKRAARRARLQALAAEGRTLVVFESAHRVGECFEDLCHVLGPEREVLVARELTKRFEESQLMRAGELGGWLARDANRQRGEFVLVIAGAAAVAEGDAEVERVLRILIKEMPPTAAARVASALTGHPRRALYDKAVKLAPSDPSS